MDYLKQTMKPVFLSFYWTFSL